MSKGTTRRSIRIDDELWDKAQEVAAERGDNLSDVIRTAIIEYANSRKSLQTTVAPQ